MSCSPAVETPNTRSDIQPIVHGGRGAEGDKSLRRTGSRLADSSVSPRSRSSASTAASAGENTPAEDKNNTLYQDDHGPRFGDLLDRGSSDSSIHSSASSVFSTANTMSHSGRKPSLHALTPLTSTDSSPPGKLPSPHSAKPSPETMHAISHTALSSAHTKTATDTITPVHTPPEARISVWPTDGKLGSRISYDPLMDSKLDKKAKHSGKPVYKPILDKLLRSRSYVSLRMSLSPILLIQKSPAVPDLPRKLSSPASIR
jgi:histone-lysine N-methyltransferase SETD1